MFLPKLVQRNVGIFFFTSVVVLDISAGSFHGCVAASAPPAQLAYAVPAAVTQSAPTISIAQPRAAFCVTTQQKKDRNITEV